MVWLLRLYRRGLPGVVCRFRSRAAAVRKRDRVFRCRKLVTVYRIELLKC